MEPDQIVSAVLDYLDLIENGHGSEEANIAALEERLDRLALARHYIRPTFEEHPGPPTPDRARLAELAAERFPSFGLYNVPAHVTEQIGETEIAVGDALAPTGDPVLDWWGGGWLGGRVDSLALLLARSDAETRFVPSYGPVIGRAEVQGLLQPRGGHQQPRHAQVLHAASVEFAQRLHALHLVQAP